jgi:hypothetical protein
MKRTAIRALAFSVTVASALALTTTSSVAAGSLPTLKLALTKNTVTVGGPKVSGAVDVVTTVSGEASDSPTLILLKPGVTAAQLGKLVSKFGAKPFDAIDPYATIEFAGGTDPAGSRVPRRCCPPAAM